MPELGKIFHVDDNPTILEVTARFVERYGHQTVLTAASLAIARGYIPDTLRQTGVNCSILDGKLPDGSGLEIAELIRESGLSIGVISFAGQKESWGDYNVVKPAYLELMDTIHKVLNP